MSEEASQSVYEELDRAADAVSAEESEETAAATTEEAVEATEEVTEEATEEITEEQEDTEELAVEPETVEDPEEKERDVENALKSWFGRKLKERDTEYEERLDRLTALLEKSVTSDDEDEDEDAIITKKDLPKYFEKIEQQKADKQAQYERKYTNEFAKLGAEDDNFDAVWEEMLAHHNSVRTGDPAVDAELNYTKAENALLKKSKPQVPVKGKGSTKNTTVNVPKKMKEKETKPIQLDKEAQELAQRLGLKDDYIQEALK